MKQYGFSLKWLAVSSFELRFGNTTIVTDPYITECAGTDLTWENVENCDLICLGHAHWDHITDIPRLQKKFNPKILCGDQTALPLVRWLDCNPSFVYPMYPDTELDFGDVKVRALYGRHTSLGKSLTELLEKTKKSAVCSADPQIQELQEIGSFEYRNFLFTLPNGTKILLWGSSPTVEQINLCKSLKPDVAIIQDAASQLYIEKKAAFAAAIGCKVVIPHHHDFHKIDPPDAIDCFCDEFLKRVPDGIFLKPKHGEWIDL